MGRKGSGLLASLLKTVFTLGVLGLIGLGLLAVVPADFTGPIGNLQQDVREGLGIDGGIGGPPGPTPNGTADPTGTAPPVTPTITVEPRSVDERETEIESHFHELVNETRAEHDLPELSLDSELSVVARYHSQRMAAFDFFAHVDPHSGRDPTDRGQLFDYTCREVDGLLIRSGIGENLFMVGGFMIQRTSPDEMAERALEGLMNSPSHRENLLTEHYDREGVGVYETNQGMWLTQNFC